MLNIILAGVSGAVLTLGVIVVYISIQKRRYEKEAKEELKKLEAEMNNYLQKLQASKTSQFQKGDFLKIKEVQRQPWEKDKPVQEINAEVLEVGNGAYLMELMLAGYAPQKQTISFADAHAAFIKDTERRAKPQLSVVKND